MLFVLSLLPLFPARLHAGQVIVTPSLALKEEYNDNIFTQVSGRRGDLISTVSPALAVSRGTENSNVSLAGGVNELLYLRNGSSDGLGYSLQGSGNYAVTPRLALSADLGGTRDISASSVDPATSLVTSSRTLHQSYKLGESYHFSELLSSTLSLGYGRDDYDNRAYLATRHYQANSELDYDLGRRLPGAKLAQVLSFSRDATDVSQVDSVGVTLGFSKNVSELWLCSLSGGGRFTSSRFQVAGSAAWKTNDEWGEIGNLSLNYTGAKLSGSLTVSQDLSAASGRAGATQRTGGSLSLSDRFTPRFTGNLGASYARNLAGQDQFAGGAIDEWYRNLSASLRYEFFQAPSDLALETSYTFNNTDYRLLGTQMNQNVVMVRLIWQSPRTK